MSPWDSFFFFLKIRSIHLPNFHLKTATARWNLSEVISLAMLARLVSTSERARQFADGSKVVSRTLNALLSGSVLEMWKGCWFPGVVALVLNIFWKWCMAFPRVKKGLLLRMIYIYISLRLFIGGAWKSKPLKFYIVSGMKFNFMFDFDGSCHQEFFGNSAIWFRLAGRNSDLQGLRLAGRIDWICVACWNYLKLPLTWPLLGDLRQKHHFGCFLKIEMKDYLFWTAADSARIFQRLRLWHVLHVLACC